jgi:hypothetical protein
MMIYKNFFRRVQLFAVIVLSVLSGCTSAPQVNNDNSIATSVAATIAAQPAPTQPPLPTQEQATPVTQAAPVDTTTSASTVAQNDADSGSDASASEENALLLDLNPASPYMASLPIGDEGDTFQFDLPGGSRISFAINVLPDSQALNLIFKREGVTLFEGGLIEEGEEFIRTWLHNSTDEAGRYTLKITPYDTIPAYAKDIAYAFTIESTAQQDGNAEGDAGDSATLPRAIEPNSSYSGQVGYNDKVDAYAITVPGGSVIDLSYQLIEGNPLLAGLYRDGIKLIDFGLASVGDIDRAQWTLEAEASETTYVFVIEQADTTYSGISPYEFTIAHTPQQDGGNSGDAGGSEATARDIELGQSFLGVVSGQDTKDYYRLTLNEPTKLVLQARIPDQGRGDMFIYLWLDGKQVNYGRIYEGNPLTITANEPLAAGTYFIRIEGDGDYQIDIRAE